MKMKIEGYEIVTFEKKKTNYYLVRKGQKSACFYVGKGRVSEVSTYSINPIMTIADFLRIEEIYNKQKEKVEKLKEALEYLKKNKDEIVKRMKALIEEIDKINEKYNTNFLEGFNDAKMTIINDLKLTVWKEASPEAVIREKIKSIKANISHQQDELEKLNMLRILKKAIDKKGE